MMWWLWQLGLAVMVYLLQILTVAVVIVLLAAALAAIWMDVRDGVRFVRNWHHLAWLIWKKRNAKLSHGLFGYLPQDAKARR
jgi:hypothetical protein